MFTKHEFKLEMFVSVSWSYSKHCILIVRITVPRVDHSEIDLDFVETFSVHLYAIIYNNYIFYICWFLNETLSTRIIINSD